MGIGYCLSEWTVRPHRNRIERGGESVHIAPKAMAVLNCLAKASNSVVTRQDIFDAVWPGAVVSDEVLTHRIADLRKAFKDSAQHPKIIETIPKIGFRLIPTVVPLPEEAVTKQGSHPVAGSRHRMKWLAFAVGGLLLAAVLLNRFWPLVPAVKESLKEPERPVIAVLPFVNMSEDPGNEHFSDGISEELINLLAQVTGLHVISRSSSFSFKGENWRMADLASELNATLIVEGTVRKVENQLRITAQLIDPGNDNHLWSDSYDRELSDIFSLQEEIAQSIVNAIQDQIGPHTVVGESPTENIGAYELFLSGRHHFYQRGAALDRAIMLLQMAVEKDPEFAEAWTYLAAAATISTFYRTAISYEDSVAMAVQASNQALALNPGLGLAQSVQAMVAYTQNDLERGFRVIERAVDQSPNNTTVRLWAGLFGWYWGYLEMAHTHFLYAYQHDPRVGIINGSLGLLYLVQGREDLAAPYLAKATELGYPNHHHAQISLLMKRGDFEAAFAKLKITLAGPRTNPDLLPWIYELEEAGRSYVEDRGSADALVSVVERAPGPGVAEKVRLALLFDLKDPFFEYLSIAVDEGNLWLPYAVPTLWLPEYRDYVEDPRFFEVMRRVSAVKVWEERGYLDGCIPVNDPAGDRLDCSQRY